MKIPISIIGAGHCGSALAADLLSRGIDALLFAHYQHSDNLDTIRMAGHLKTTLAANGHVHPRLSTSIAEVLEFSRYIIITVPAYGHDTIIDELAKFDLRDHVIICITGNFFSLAARRYLNAKALVETSTSPYASRNEDGKVRITGIKKLLPIASIPVNLTSDIRADIEAIFPMPLDWRENVLEIGLSCVTGVIHPVPALMNAGWIETTSGDFYFYKEGMSSSVCRVIDQLDQERQSIARGFGLKTSSVVDIINGFYGHSFFSFTEFARNSPEHNVMRMAPEHMRHRFVSQDVPYVLVPWFQLGQRIGIECSTIGSIIKLASVVNNTDYLAVGRNLHSLGLETESKKEILEIVGAVKSLPETVIDSTC